MVSPSSISLWVALGVLLFMGAAEALHVRRIRRLGRLGFAPHQGPPSWTIVALFLKPLAGALAAWALTTLLLLPPSSAKKSEEPEGGYRHLIIALDVSPSMQLKDAGPEKKQTRAQRASEILLSLLSRTALDQVRVTVVAFYTGAKPVVVDTFDLEVVKNILDDLPLDYAFEIGKTTLFKGIEEAAALAKPWKAGSAVLVLVSDGDTVPDTGMPSLPESISHKLIVGVGDPRTGVFIDGHQSRQDAFTLRQVANRLGGVYYDANDLHLPSESMKELSAVLPMKKEGASGLREMALCALAIGAAYLAGLPLALAFWGSARMPLHSINRTLTQTKGELCSENS